MKKIILLALGILMFTACSKKGSAPDTRIPKVSTCIFSKLSNQEIENIRSEFGKYVNADNPKKSCSSRTHIFMGVALSEALNKKMNKEELKSTLENNGFSSFISYNLDGDLCLVKENINLENIKNCKWEE